MILTRYWVILAASVMFWACGCGRGVEPTTPPPQPTPPSPPPSPAVEILDLIPAAATGATLIEVEVIRGSNHGPPLLDALRSSIGTREWEQMAQIDLTQDVERFLHFVRVEPEQAHGDLADLMNRQNASMIGMVFELTPTVERSFEQCREADLGEVRLEPVQSPMRHGFLGRCGQFVITSCCTPTPPQPARNDSPAARTLGRLPEPAEGFSIAAAATLGPEVLNRASCEHSTIALTGWHLALVELGDGLTIRGRIHASTPAEAPDLQDCIEDGVGNIASNPLLMQLGVARLLSAVNVAQDPGDEKDVLVTVPLDSNQTSFLISLIGFLGPGGMP